MQTATTTSPLSPPPAETPERKSLRESLNVQRRAALMLLRDAEKRLKELDEADAQKRKP